AWLPTGPEMRPRPAGADQRLQGDLQVLDVRGAALVQDDDIDHQSLEAPVLAGAQDLADDGRLLDLVDAHQHDRHVARDSLRPQEMLSCEATANRIRRGAQRRTGVDHVPGEALVE